MSEDLTDYLLEAGIRTRYLHSEVDTLKRIELLRDLRLGEYDVLVGINLLREGLDLPEVSLVAILDADKEGFLRSDKSLIQTIGRAARNVSGQVHHVRRQDHAVDGEGDRRDQPAPRRSRSPTTRPHGVDPQPLRKKIADITEMLAREDEDTQELLADLGRHRGHAATGARSRRRRRSGGSTGRSSRTGRACPTSPACRPPTSPSWSSSSPTRCSAAAAELQFELAARLRDEISDLKKELRQMMEATR